MREQCGAVHQKGFDVGEAGAQLGEDGEAVGVDVAPVVDGAVLQPLGAGERLPAVAGAEDHDGLVDAGEGEEVGLVLGDEDARHVESQAGEAVGVEGEVGAGRAGEQAERRVEHAQAKQRGLVEEAVAGGELLRAVPGEWIKDFWCQRDDTPTNPGIEI